MYGPRRWVLGQRPRKGLRTWSTTGEVKKLALRNLVKSLGSLKPVANSDTLARPARIMTVDVDGPLPELRADDHFRDAWVVLCRNGIPLGITTLDLTADVDVTRGRLQSHCVRLRDAQPVSRSRDLSDTELPKICVIVPTIAQRIDELTLCVESLRGLDYPDFEIVLVDNRRVVPVPDPLVALTHDRPWLRVVREPKPGISAARNTGIAHTSADVIAFTDDDVQVDHLWLRAIATRLTLEPSLDAVTGLVLPAELESAAQIWYERYFGGFGGVRTFSPVSLELERTQSPLHQGHLSERDANGTVARRSSLYGVGRYVAGANMAFRRTALERIHGFDTVLGTGTPSRGGEDLAAMMGLLWRGGHVGYEPAAFVYHRHRREYADLLKQLDGSGLGFTAMLTSLVRDDPRHLLAILGQIPLVIRRMVPMSAERLRGRRIGGPGDKQESPTRQYPPTLFLREYFSYLRGPFAYLRSCAATRANTANS